MLPSGATVATLPIKKARPSRLRLYRPHAGQQRLHESTARFRVVTTGRRWGKTFAAVNELARAAWLRPGSMTMWVAPFYPQTKIAFRLLAKHFRAALKEPPSLTELRVVWRNGSVTQFRSADNYDAIRGEGIHFVVVDEAAMTQRAAWEEAIRPTLSDTLGRALILSTPKGRNWFWELWCRGQDPAAWPGWESWQCPTRDSPYVEDSEVREAEQSLPHDVFLQEYEAQFLEDSAGVFRAWRQCEQGVLEPEPVVGVKGPVPYVIGWDPARYSDASVMMVMDTQRRHVVAFERLLRMDYRRQLALVEALSQRYHGATVLMDATHGSVGDPLLPQLWERGVPAQGFEFTNQSKQQVIEYLALQMEQKRITFPAIPVLRTELEMFQYEVTRAGTVRYSAPEGYHDDCVSALALVTWAARGGGEVLGSDALPAKPPVRFPRLALEAS